MLAYDYPLMGVFWSIFWFFLWIMWIMVLFRIIGDVFRSHDLGGFGKAAWLIFVIVLPFFGVFIYLIARGRKMGERDLAQAQAQQAAFQSYVRDAAGTTSNADELVKLADLRDRGVISATEFEQQKARILTSTSA
jgi:energy-coupling factor transporter transmembrane protein EcfT